MRNDLIFARDELDNGQLCVEIMGFGMSRRRAVACWCGGAFRSEELGDHGILKEMGMGDRRRA